MEKPVVEDYEFYDDVDFQYLSEHAKETARLMEEAERIAPRSFVVGLTPGDYTQYTIFIGPRYGSVRVVGEHLFRPVGHEDYWLVGLLAPASTGAMYLWSGNEVHADYIGTHLTGAQHHTTQVVTAFLNLVSYYYKEVWGGC